MNRTDSEFEAARYGTQDFDYDFDQPPEPDIDRVTVPAIAHALNWIAEPRGKMGKLKRLAALRIIIGVSNTFNEAATLSIERRPIQKVLQEARKQFPI
jgi:hypothetical protein